MERDGGGERGGEGGGGGVEGSVPERVVGVPVELDDLFFFSSDRLFLRRPSKLRPHPLISGSTTDTSTADRTWDFDPFSDGRTLDFDLSVEIRCSLDFDLFPEVCTLDSDLSLAASTLDFDL